MEFRTRDTPSSWEEFIGGRIGIYRGEVKFGG
jgi:hypothetical protein